MRFSNTGKLNKPSGVFEIIYIFFFSEKETTVHAINVSKICLYHVANSYTLTYSRILRFRPCEGAVDEESSSPRTRWLKTAARCAEIFLEKKHAEHGLSVPGHDRRRLVLHISREEEEGKDGRATGLRYNRKNRFGGVLR